MNEPRTPNIRRLAIIIGLFLLLTIALLFWARDVIRELIVLPLSYIIWVLGILIDATPQIFFWLALLVIAFMIASRGLSRKRKALTSYPPGYSLPDDPSSSGRVEYWANKVNLLRSRQSGFYSRSFHSALSRLLMDLLCYRYRLGPRQVEQAAREGTLDIPEDIRAYVLESLRPPEPIGGGFFVRLWHSVVAAVRGWIGQLGDDNHENKEKPKDGGRYSSSRKDGRAARDDPRVAQVLLYIEEELEVSHGESDR